VLFVCGAREMLLRKSFCIQETGVLEESAGLFLYNENPQFNWGFKKLKAMGRKK